MRPIHCSLAALAAAVPALALSSSAGAVDLRVSIENLAPANGVSLAPLRFGFGDGTFDAFTANQVAPLLGEPSLPTAPIVTIAEGGSGSTWLPTFAATEPDAVIASTGGPVTPGATLSTVVSVDATNPFFTFAAMVVPSNDHFIGNEDPTAYRVLDADGNLILGSILQTGADVWDAGSETENPANAAFLVDGVNDLRENENGVVRFDFAGFAAYDGLVTAAGYTFDSSTVTATTPLFRITLTAVPEPASAGLLTAAALGLLARRRRA